MIVIRKSIRAWTTTAQALLLVALAVYRTLVSPMIVALFGPACRFRPTCSEYAREAVQRFGVARGSLLAARRLARCHPLGGNGYDPVLPHVNARHHQEGSFWTPADS